MEQFFDELLKSKDLYDTFLVTDIFIAIILSFASAIVISQIYKKTYKGIAYSQSFTHMLIIMEITVSVTMLAVGSNIARAFSLAGALSIVRFRISIKDPKDVGYIFFAMAAGMAIGARLYLLGAIFTAVLSLILYLLDYFEYGKKVSLNKVLKVVIPEDFKKEKIEAIIGNYVRNYYIASTEHAGDNLLEIVYIVEERNKENSLALVNELQRINDGRKVTLVEGYERIDL